MILRWIKYTVLAFAAIILLFVMFLTLPPGENLIRSMAQNILAEQLALDVSIGHLETNLLNRLVLGECEVSNPDGGPHLASLEYARLDYNILDLIRSWQSFRSLEVRGLAVNISRDASGSSNLPLTTASPQQEEAGTKTAPFSLQLGKIQFSDVSISYRDDLTQIDGALRKLKLTLNPLDQGIYTLATHADSGWVSYDGNLFHANAVAIEGRIAPDQVAISSLHLSLPGIKISGNGSLDLAEDSSPISGELRLSCNTEEVASNYRTMLPNQFASASGMVEIRIDIAGTLETPAADIRLDFEQLKLEGMSASNGHIKAHWQIESLSINAANLEIFGGYITGSGEIALDSTSNHRFDMKLNRIQLASMLSWLYEEDQPIRGIANGRLTTSGPVKLLDAIEMHALLSLNKLYYQDKEIPQLTLGGRYHGGLADLHFQQEGSEVRSKLRISGDKIAGDFSVDLKHLEHLSGLFNFPGLSGSFQASGDMAGSMSSPTINAKVAGKDVHYQNFPLDSLTGSIVFKDDKLTVYDTFFAGRLSPIDSLNPPFNLKDFRGGFSYQGTITGPLENPEARIDIELFNPEYQDIRFGGGVISLEIEDQQIRLKQFRLDNDSLFVESTGLFSLPNQGGEFEILFLGPSILTTDQPAIQDSEKSTASKEKINIISGGFSIADSIAWDIDIDGKQLDLTKVVSLFPDQRDVSGRLDFNFRFDGSPSFPSAFLDFTLINPRFEQVDLDSIRGIMQLNDNKFYYSPVEFYKRGYRSWAEGEITLRKNQDGSYDFLADSPITGKAEGKDIDLRLFGSFMADNPIRAGLASYQFEWVGVLGRPRITGSIEISNGLIKLDESTTPIQNVSLRAVLEDTLLDIQRMSGMIAGAPLNLNGTIASHNWERFQTDFFIGLPNSEAMRGRGIVTSDSLEFELGANDFNLSILQGFIPDLQAFSGTLNTAMKITGPFSGPELDGRLDISSLSFNMPVLNTSLTSGTIKARFDQSHIRVDSLSAKLGGGSLNAKGTLSMDSGDLVDADITARMRSIAVNAPKEYMFNMESGLFSLKKQGPYFVLDGDLVLGETRLLYHIRPQDILPFAQEVERPFQSPGKLVNQIRMNIRIRETDRLWIDNNLARIRLHSEVAVIGNLANPNFAGRISVEEGYLMYLDRKFLIKTGVLDFVDPNRPNPFVDIKAEANIKSYQSLKQTPYTINLSINGMMEEAVIELTSDPPLEKPDIIALLTIGATREQVTGNNTTTGTSLTDVIRDRLMVFSNQKVSGYTSRTLGNLLGLETMSIEGDLLSLNGASGPQLLASKKISDRVEVTYTTTVGHANEQNIRLDYRLSKFFSLEGQTNQRGQPGMDLKFGIRFK